MNARKFLNVRVSLTVTALALSGALVFSAMTTSCASSSSGGSGGNSGGSGGSGGSAGGTTGGSCADPASDAVNFCNGKAQGVMTGYAYIALGSADTASDPVCAPDSSDMTTTQNITAAGTTPGACPTTGTTVWNTSDALCISGTIPIVTGGDYTSNWGLQIGVNSIDPPATSAGSGTLGHSYATIAATTTGSVTPTNTAIRLVIHLVGTPDTDNPYCATVASSGKAITLTDFNTQCWNGSSCGAVPACTPGADQTTCCNQLKDTDIPNIDKIGIQISSDAKQPYVVDNYCLTGYQFGN